MLIGETTPDRIVKFSNDIEGKIHGAKELEEAAQRFVQSLYNAFKESIVLVRTFVTIPIAELPREIQGFANNLAQGAGIAVPLPRDEMILTLFGTAGVAPEWNDRKQSKGHVGIPLASVAFVGAIPMMSALLEQLGFDLGWIRGEKEIVARCIGSLGGTFFVKDAPTSKDSKDRFIIAGQEFVKKYGVHSVFGFGGGYTGVGKFMVTIVFTRETFDRSKATMFQSLANMFKISTGKVIKNQAQFFR